MQISDDSGMMKAGRLLIMRSCFDVAVQTPGSKQVCAMMTLTDTRRWFERQTNELERWPICFRKEKIPVFYEKFDVITWKVADHIIDFTRRSLLRILRTLIHKNLTARIEIWSLSGEILEQPRYGDVCRSAHKATSSSSVPV